MSGGAKVALRYSVESLEKMLCDIARSRIRRTRRIGLARRHACVLDRLLVEVMRKICHERGSEERNAATKTHF